MSEQSFDVVIIPTGIAGVTAARDLSFKGYSVALVEARDRVDGRLYTAKRLMVTEPEVSTAAHQLQLLVV